MKTKLTLLAALCGVVTVCFAATPDDGSVLPFPAIPMKDSVATPRLQDAKMKWPAPPQRLPKDAPNILIVLLDDIGFGVAETFGGEVRTPTLTKLANSGLRYNAFHTTAICSPTRAALLTGRNHTRVGSGGGLTLYMDKGQLVYLYNMMIIEQYEARSAQPLAAGKHKIIVETSIAGPGKPGAAIVKVDGKEIGKAELKRTVPAAFTASESLDVGIDLGSTVAESYADRRPFEFNGKIGAMKVELK